MLKATENEKNALLGELFENYRGVILFSILKVLGDEDKYLAEDCLSQTFLIACQKKDILLSKEKPILWLIATGKNCARHLKRQAHTERKKMCPLDDQHPSFAEEREEDFIEDMIYEEWIRNNVPQMLINELHPRTRQAFIAKYKEGKSNAEIAAEMNITESTVRTFLTDARKQITARVKSGKL